MFSVALGFVNGMMLGIEFPPINEEDSKEVGFVMVIDLLILRFILTKWKPE